MPIYLIPHVTNPTSNDYEFMRQALSIIDNGTRMLSRFRRNMMLQRLWIISKMTYSQARTHSTIAALSSGVPTLSFAYSIRSRINRDIFGHRVPHDPGEPSAEVSDKIDRMLGESTAVRKELMKDMPRAQGAALSAGMELKHLIEVS